MAYIGGKVITLAESLGGSIGSSLSSVQGDVMEEIDKVAGEIYKHMVKDWVPFEDLNIEAKRFYRRIARWHLKKMKI
jgi:hypothetical protein